jgi:hypothetical protein
MERCDIDVVTDSWAWECATCDRIEGGYASPEEARKDAARHTSEMDLWRSWHGQGGPS